MDLHESLFGLKKDVFFMKRALLQAQRAYVRDEVPVGAIVVASDGNVLGRGYNRVEKQFISVNYIRPVIHFLYPTLSHLFEVFEMIRRFLHRRH